MTISSWMIRNRSLRSRVRTMPEDCYRLDATKPVNESAFDIFRELSSRMTTESRRLSLLNAFVKLMDKVQVDDTFGFKTRELLYCLSASLVHHFTQVRAGALRAIRYLLRRPTDIKMFNQLLLPHLVCRSLDVLLDNEEERVQALKLIRKMLAIAPDDISPILVRSLVALGEDGDRMLRACLATLCEFGVLNPSVLIVCGGVSAITRNVLECHSPRIAESLVGVLLHLLEWPQTRDIAGVRLDCLAAPYCDFTYRLGIMDKNKDARDLRFTCSRLALLSVLRSWAGTIEFCNPNRASGLKAIVDVLYLNQLEVRKAILDLLYELLWLPQPVWTDEYSVALAVVDPADYQDSWRLADGFVAMEGRNVLPSLANRVPNICEIHTALLLYCFLRTGLLNALVEVVISSDTFLSVRATVLIGKLLQLMHTHLPADILNTSSALPTLVSHATRGNHQAKASITALQKLHQMLKNRPAACSLFLDNIIQNGNIINSKIFKREIDANNDQTGVSWPSTTQSPSSGQRMRLDSIGSSTSSSFEEYSEASRTKRALNSIKRSKLGNFLEHFRHGERLLRYSNVLNNEDGKAWDWEIIVAILKRTEPNSKFDDIHLRFIKRLVNFYKPSSNRFSHQDLGHGRHIPTFVTAGMELIDWLAQSDSLECIRLLTDFFTDINTQLIAISTSRSAHDCLFSPQHMSSTMCQQYFLFIGRMCRTSRGIVILNNTDIFKQLTSIVTTTIHVCYIKLIVSGLDYSFDETPRKILEMAMSTSDRRSGRLYATQFMLVLLRARIPNFEVWGLPLLIQQTKDTNRVVALAALEILDEAAHDRIYLEELVSIWPNFEKLDDAGRLIMTRFYSIPRGLNHHNAQIKQQIVNWRSGYNKSYVLLLEADTHSILTLHTKNEDGAYSRRSCSSRPTVIPPNILPHLYGQLVQTSQGLTNLIKFGNLPELIDIITLADCQIEADSLLLKSAMWAISHSASSRSGIEHLIKLDANIFQKFIVLAKHCRVYSIRATALHVLCLIGSTKYGADILYKLDWVCVRHDRDTSWPICEPEDWLSKHISPIRHPLDEVPPYNYKGIDENIDAIIFNNRSGTVTSTITAAIDDLATYYFDESSCDKVDAANSGSEIDIRNSSAARAKTLPEGVTKSAFIKHTRSLSESKTTDGISLTTTATTRTRFNSGTDSNTSGVSSCESVYGRYMLGEKHNTLSPIPSSSNLLEVKSNERFRRTSLTGASFRESTLSPQDVKGYAQLRKLRSNQRPMLSESAADELAEIIDGSGVAGSGSLYAQQRRLKVRSLDRHFKACMYEAVYYRPTGPIEVPEPTRRITVGDVSDGPCYAGICLPKNIFDLFHTDSSTTGTYVSRCIADIDQLDVPSRMTNSSTKQSVGGSFPAVTNGFGEGELSSVSSMSDISTNSKRIRWIGRHNQGSCLHCCRSNTVANRMADGSNDGAPRRKISNQSSLMQLSDMSFNSLNSPESMFSEEYMADKVTGNILRHVQRMANPVWSKQSKMALLEMKQKHPQSFQDICLYSEVCRALSTNTYRLYARRFLQELFLDLDFDTFNSESSDIIGRKEKEQLSTTVGSFDCVDNGRTSNGSGSDELLTTITTNPEHIYANIKMHTRAPQLASVYETSIENLAESMGKLRHLEAANHWRVPGFDYNAMQLDVLRDEALKMAYEQQSNDPRFIEIWLVDKSKTLQECIKLFGKPKQYSVDAIPHRGWRYDSTRNAFNNAAMTTFDWVYDSVACVFRKNKRDDATSNTDSTTTTSATLNRAERRAAVSHRNSSASTDDSKNEANSRLMRPRFNTLELDLSCTKNLFPISDRRKQIEQQVKCSDKLSLTQFEWVFDASDNTFKRSSYNELAGRSSVPTTPVSCDMSLFCEKRLVPSKSEASLSQNQKP